MTPERGSPRCSEGPAALRRRPAARRALYPLSAACAPNPRIAECRRTGAPRSSHSNGPSAARPRGRVTSQARDGNQAAASPAARPHGRARERAGTHELARIRTVDFSHFRGRFVLTKRMPTTRYHCCPDKQSGRRHGCGFSCIGMECFGATACVDVLARHGSDLAADRPGLGASSRPGHQHGHFPHPRQAGRPALDRLPQVLLPSRLVAPDAVGLPDGPGHGPDDHRVRRPGRSRQLARGGPEHRRHRSAGPRGPSRSCARCSCCSISPRRWARRTTAW